MLSFTQVLQQEMKSQELLGMSECEGCSCLGHDELSFSLFRGNIDIFFETLGCLLCNISMRSGIVPDKMELARVT